MKTAPVCPLPVAEPADPGRQALERDARFGHLDPAAQPVVVGEELEDRPVGAQDVSGVAGQRDPAERSATLAELRPDERGHEARVVEGIGDARLERLGAQVVSVVERDRARRLEGEDRPDVVCHRAHRAPQVLVGLRGPQRDGIVQRDLRGNVAGQRIVRRGLVGDDVEPLAGRRPGRLDLGGVPDQRDGDGVAGRRGSARPCQRFIGIAGEPVDVPDLQPSARPLGVDLDREAYALVHRDGQRLRPPIPPSPAVSTTRPRSVPPKCWRASSANVSYVPWRMPWVPM